MNILLKKTSIAVFGLASVITVNAFAADEGQQNKSIFKCTLTDMMKGKDMPGDAKNNFTVTTSKIYLICHSDKVAKGVKVKSTWIAADTNNVAPANYQIDERVIEIPRQLAKDEVWTGNFSLLKPNKNWPVGSYHVDVYVNDTLDSSYNFSIQNSKSMKKPQQQSEAVHAQTVASNEQATDASEGQVSSNETTQTNGSAQNSNSVNQAQSEGQATQE